MNAAQRIDHATARLHAAIDAMLTKVVTSALANAGAPVDAPPELRAKVTELTVDRLLIDLERAHPGVVERGELILLTRRTHQGD